MPDEVKRDVLAEHGQGLQYALLLGWQAVDTGAKNALHGGWNPHLPQRAGHPDVAVARQHAFIKEPLHQLLDEERIAAALVGNQPLERPQFGRIAEQRREQFFGALLV